MNNTQHGQRKSTRKVLMVVEAYYMEANTCKGWTAVNKTMTVSEIYLAMKSGKIASVNVKVKDTDYHGRDFNINTFLLKYKEVIMEELILRAEEQKEKVFYNFRSRRNSLTSYDGIDSANFEIYQEGIYFDIDGHCHTSIRFFMDNEGTVKRKPRNIECLLTSRVCIDC